MQILSRYLLSRFLRLFAVALFVLALTVMLAELLLHIDDVMETGEGFKGAATYLLLKLPAEYLWALVPIAAFVACFACLGTAARSLEITAIKAGGVSPLRACVPLLVAAAAISLLHFVFSESAGVWAQRAWNRKFSGAESEISYRRGSFWYHKARVIYNIRKTEPETQTLEGVRIYELDDAGHLVRSIHARQAQLVAGNRWHFEDAAIREFDTSDPLAPVRFKRVEETTLELAGEEDLALFDAEPAGLSLRNLREYINEESFEGENVTRLRAHLHQRIADPFTALLFVLLAIPIGLCVEQTRNLGRAALSGMIIMTGFWVVRSLGITLTSKGAMAAPVTPWLALALFGLLGLWSLRRVPT